MQIPASVEWTATCGIRPGIGFGFSAFAAFEVHGALNSGYLKRRKSNRRLLM